MERSWFHAHISGIEADRLLMSEGKPGSFLVRPSQTTEGNLSLSVRLADSVSHVKIHKDGDCVDLGAPAGGETFSTLSDLICYYVNGAGQGSLKDKDGRMIELKFPLPTSDHSTERFFHREITGPQAEQVLISGATGTFLVRKSQTQAENFVLSVKTDNQRIKILHVIIYCKNNSYDIGDGNKFRSLAELVNHYRSNMMTDKSGIQITLRQAVDMTHFKASDISFRVAQLDKEFMCAGVRRNGFWEEFEHLQNQEGTYSYPKTSGEKPENKRKNRFKNILPYDHSRVILKDCDPKQPDSDYINANRLSVDDASMPEGKRKYIACQGCLQHTIGDFWRLIVQERCTVIVMITKLVEDGKNKCVQYWPADDEITKTYEVFQGTITVNLLDTVVHGDYIKRTLHVETKCEKGKGKSRENLSWNVYHYHFMEWMDKRIPTAERTESILSFINDFNNSWKESKYAGHLVVHCSAGIGRTGTIVVIDCILNQIKNKGLMCDIDIAKTIASLRTQRSGLVQTDLQYKFIYLAVKRFIEISLGPASSPAPKMPSDTVSLYENIPTSPPVHNISRGIPPATSAKPQNPGGKKGHAPPAPTIQGTLSAAAAAAAKASIKRQSDVVVQSSWPPEAASQGQSQATLYENLDCVKLAASTAAAPRRSKP